MIDPDIEAGTVPPATSTIRINECRDAIVADLATTVLLAGAVERSPSLVDD
jgi:hypothetical protein